MCLTPAFTALPLYYVFNLSLVFGIFDIAFDFIDVKDIGQLQLRS